MHHHIRLTDEQYRRQPDLAREIIDLDRRLEAERPAGNVVPLGRGDLIQRRRNLPAGWFSKTYAAPDGGGPMGGAPVAVAA